MGFQTSSIDRSRIGWWLLTLVLAGALLFTLYSFVGTFVLGVFIYYGTRPVYRRIHGYLGSRGLAAAVTLLAIALPTLALLGYLGYTGLRELSAADLGTIESLLAPYVDITSFTENPRQAVLSAIRGPSSEEVSTAFSAALGGLGAFTNALVHLFLILAFVFFLLRDGHRLAGWFRSQTGADSAAYAYATAVDGDLRTVYFGNVLTVLLVTVLAVLTYNGLNTIAPAAVSIPFPTLLALLTGLATFVPIVVGKIVYVPVALSLGVIAVRTNSTTLWFPAVFLVTCFLLLDMLPVMFLRPYLSGRSIHGGLMMFAYILGSLLFGWYGLFLGPLVLVLVVQLVRIVFSELVHGERVTPRVSVASSLGSDPDAGAGASGED